MLDSTVNTRVTDVQSLQYLYIPLYCDSHNSGRKNAQQPIFPYEVIQSSLTHSACNFVFVGPNNIKFGTNIRSTQFCRIKEDKETV